MTLAILSVSLGMLVGSFLNVCIYRIPNHMSVVLPRSHCPQCGHVLSAPDLVPVASYLVLKGRCRHCGGRISPRYMGVELFEGALFGLCFYAFGAQLQTLVAWVLMAFLTVMAFIDWDYKRIPNRLVGAGMLLAVLPLGLRIAAAIQQKPSVTWQRVGRVLFQEALLPALIPSVVMLALAVLGGALARRSVLGAGDIKVMAPIGLFLGWRLALLALGTSFVSAGLFAAAGLLLKKLDGRATLPMGPFLAFGAGVCALYGEHIMVIFR